MAHDDDYDVTDYIFKVLLLGDKGVGKSSIVRRYVEDRFETWPTTVCVEYGAVTRTVKGKQVKLQIWDTAGEEKYHCLTDMYYRNTHGVMLVFDVNNADTLDHVSTTWVNQVLAKAPDDVSLVLIGSKSDVADDNDTTRGNNTTCYKDITRYKDTTCDGPVCIDDIRRFSDLYCMSYFSTSAKLNTNIEQAFDHLAELMISQRFDYTELPCPDSLPSFALHSFQPHSPVSDPDFQPYSCSCT